MPELIVTKNIDAADLDTLDGYRHYGGYEVLTKQSSPSTSFIRAARKDLAAEYEALNQPQQAARFRAELAAAAANPPIASR